MSKNANNFDVKIIRSNYVSSVPHWRYSHASVPTWRFYWNPVPGAWLNSRGKTVELLPETAVLVPPQTSFSTGSNQVFAHFFVHFTIPLYCKRDKRKIWTFNSDEVILPCFRRELPQMSGQKRFWASSSIVQAALTRLPEDIFSDQDTDSETLFDKIIKQLDQDQEFSLSYSELAHRCGASVNTLHREFASATGLSIHKWRLNRRMEKAVQLLLHDNMSIKETADILGFADRYHFSKTFKHYFGISPAQFVKSGGIPLP